MTKRKTGWLICCLTLCSISHGQSATSIAPNSETASSAAEGGSLLKVEEVLGDKKFEEDKRITDLELRAQAGSLSRYSLQFALGYAGPPINDLSLPDKPNPDHRAGDMRTNASGNASLRYRLTPNVGVNFGTGFTWYTPFQAVSDGDTDRGPGLKSYDVSDPTISIDRTYVVGHTQMRSSLFAEETTTHYYVNRGEWGEFGFNQYFKYNPGTSRVILGMQTAVDYFAFERPYLYANAKGRGGDGRISKYYLNFIPSFEYKITSSLNFNTSIGYPYQNMRSDPAWWRWTHQLSTWRVGVGWAITHDIYINPFINFFAEAPAFNTASASMNTVFSIF